MILIVTFWWVQQIVVHKTRTRTLTPETETETRRETSLPMFAVRPSIATSSAGSIASSGADVEVLVWVGKSSGSPKRGCFIFYVTFARQCFSLHWLTRIKEAALEASLVALSSSWGFSLPEIIQNSQNLGELSVNFKIEIYIHVNNNLMSLIKSLKLFACSSSWADGF